MNGPLSNAEVDAANKAPVVEEIAHGFKLCAIPPGTKGPRTKDWNVPGNELKSADDLPAGWGVGLLHAASHTAALDCDDLEQTTKMLKEHGIDLQALLDAPDAVQIISGKANRAKLLYSVPPFLGPLITKRITYRTAEGINKTAYELRCATADGLSVQDVLPPSIHPETLQPYRWGGAGDWRRLPMLPVELLDLWQSLIDADSERGQPATADGIANSTPWEEIESALRAIPADCSRDDWIAVGMALSSTGNPAALSAWRDWSATGEKYKGEREINSQWRSFKPAPDGIGIGSVFHIAKQYGWVRPAPDASGLFSEVSTDDDEWSDPLPLPNLPPVPALDLALLPAAIRPWIADVSERMQIVPDVPAIGAITALSIAIGRRVQIMPKERDEWTVVPNLWGMCVAPPGYMKSPALSQVMRPLHNLEREANREYEAAMAVWAMEKERNAIAKSAAKSAALSALKKDPTADISLSVVDSDEPVPKRYVVNNFTLEAIGEVMIGNENGVLAFADELYGLLKMADKPMNEELNTFLLTSWNGDEGYTFDRIGRGRRYVPHVCLSALGGIQPGRLVEYLTGGGYGGAIDSGFVNRFQLLTWPDLREEWTLIDRKPDYAAQEAYHNVFLRVTGQSTFPNLAAPSAQISGDDVRHFDAEAQTVFNEWYEQNERLVRGDTLLPVMASHLSKYRSLVPSLALIFAVADDVKGNVPAQYVHQAIGWANYLRPHAERAFACTTRPETAHARALLAKIKNGSVPDIFTPRDIYRHEWSLLTDRIVVDKAIALLCDYDYLSRVDTPSSSKGGRPQLSYQINPKLTA
jgi:hypothetical protein